MKFYKVCLASETSWLLVCLADMPELGSMSSKEAAALVGVAPFNRESGNV